MCIRDSARTIDPSVYERNRESADAENKYVIRCMNTDKICVFTDQGKMHTVKVLDVPFGKFRDKGTPVDNICNYSSEKEQAIYVDCLTGIRDKKQMCIRDRATWGWHRRNVRYMKTS